MARVLLVEDDNLLRKSVQRILEKAGHEVWEATNAKAALSILKQAPIDIVITDIQMPGMNGVDLILQIEGNTRVIAMSGGDATKDREPLLADARDAGAEHTLAKPFESRELIEAIEAVLRNPGA